MDCSACGAPLTPAAVFCSRCGARVPPQGYDVDELTHTVVRPALAPGFAPEALQGQNIQLHVGLAPLAAPGEQAPAEKSLVGPTDLPAPPPGAPFQRVRSERPSAGDALLVLYDANYRDAPVRIALMEREVRDAAGQAYRMRAFAVEPTTRRNAVLDAALQRELWQDARMLALTVALVWLGIAWSLRPLRRLQASVLARDADDLRPLDARRVPGEVMPLVEAVNHHLAREREMLASQQQFLADASHQLRTPLAIMMTQAGYALREHDAARVHETLRALVAQLDRSRRLSNQLLSLANADRPATEASEAAEAAAPERTDLAGVAQELVLQKNLSPRWDTILPMSETWHPGAELEWVPAKKPIRVADLMEEHGIGKA